MPKLDKAGKDMAGFEPLTKDIKSSVPKDQSVKIVSGSDQAELDVHKQMNQKRFNEIWGIWSVWP